MPANVLALEPPVMASVESLKLAATKLATLAPVGLVVSSVMAASGAVARLTTGASFTALTVAVRATALMLSP